MCHETKLKLKVRADLNDNIGGKGLNFEAILMLSQLKIKLYHCARLKYNVKILILAFTGRV